MKTCFCIENPNSTGVSLDHSDYDFHFESQLKVKDTTLLVCRDCNTIWLFENGSSNRWCHRIYSLEQFDLVNEWLTTDTTAAHLKNAAEEIGAASSDYIEYPCKASFKTGEIRDLCVLTRWTHHPQVSWPSMKITNFKYASEVASIEPSEFSLSLKNRIAMRNANEEYFRDNVPLVLEFDDELCFRDYGNRTYYLDSNFLRYKNIKGPDIRAVTQDLKRYSEAKDKEDLKNAVTLILFHQW